QNTEGGPHYSLIPLTADMLEEDNDEICWNNLENFRVKLISVIDPSRITPYLRQCKVLSPDDEEQVLNDPSLVMRKRKAGVLLDILQRTGHKGFEAFMESLELYYPQLYRKITGKEPSRVFSMIIGNVCVLNSSSPFGAAVQSQEHSLCALEGKDSSAALGRGRKKQEDEFFLLPVVSVTLCAGKHRAERNSGNNLITHL
uniref:CARD domain-containing protein n=1 Tax=Malurus cyaneus samueli TaxID=2593467 RepID=A0A8C5UJS7_9PASS